MNELTEASSSLLQFDKFRRLALKCLSPLPSYNKFRKFRYFKALFRRNKSYSAFRHLLNGGRNRQFEANFPPYWIQKGTIDRLGTSKLVTSTRYLTLECLIVISYCNMRNTLGRRVAGGCSAFPDVHKGLILHATPFLDDESPETRKYPATEVGWFRKTKESEGKFLDTVWDTLLKTTIFVASASMKK